IAVAAPAPAPVEPKVIDQTPVESKTTESPAETQPPPVSTALSGKNELAKVSQTAKASGPAVVVTRPAAPGVAPPTTPAHAQSTPAGLEHTHAPVATPSGGLKKTAFRVHTKSV